MLCTSYTVQKSQEEVKNFKTFKRYFWASQSHDLQIHHMQSLQTGTYSTMLRHLKQTSDSCHVYAMVGNVSEHGPAAVHPTETLLFIPLVSPKLLFPVLSPAQPWAAGSHPALFFLAEGTALLLKKMAFLKGLWDEIFTFLSQFST